MLDPRHERLPDGTVMIDNDPFVVHDDRMKSFAKQKFDEAGRLGYTSKEDKSRYLSGRLYEATRFCTRKGAMDENAIQLFDDVTSGDEGKKCIACPQRAKLQRALLESQGVKTRFAMYGIMPRVYPLKPVPNDAVAATNGFLRVILKPLATIGVLKANHLTTEGWFCDDEANQQRCSWKLLDATFDDTTRSLKARPVIDPDNVIGEDHPASFAGWKAKYHDANPSARIINDIAENVPVIGDIVQRVIESGTDMVRDANPHVPMPPVA